MRNLLRHPALRLAFGALLMAGGIRVMTDIMSGLREEIAALVERRDELAGEVDGAAVDLAGDPWAEQAAAEQAAYPPPGPGVAYHLTPGGVEFAES